MRGEERRGWGTRYSRAVVGHAEQKRRDGNEAHCVAAVRATEQDRTGQDRTGQDKIGPERRGRNRT